jgi:aryl-alcohol dehydrogenase-like predicted oxidoreductase
MAGMTAIIIDGDRRRARRTQLCDNLDAISWSLSPEQVAKLDKASD